MTAPNLLDELEGVVRLCDKASAMLPSAEGTVAIKEAETAATNWVITHHATLADMAKRLEAAERDAAEVLGLLPGAYYMDPPDGGDVPVIEQLRRMAKDAARYRWLRDKRTQAELDIVMHDEGDELDYAIDAAIDAQHNSAREG